MDGWMMDGWMHAYMHAWMDDGWMDGWIDGWMDGWMNPSVFDAAQRNSSATQPQLKLQLRGLCNSPELR